MYLLRFHYACQGETTLTRRFLLPIVDGSRRKVAGERHRFCSASCGILRRSLRESLRPPFALSDFRLGCRPMGKFGSSLRWILFHKHFLLRYLHWILVPAIPICLTPL